VLFRGHKIPRPSSCRAAIACHHDITPSMPVASQSIDHQWNRSLFGSLHRPQAIQEFFRCLLQRLALLNTRSSKDMISAYDWVKSDRYIRLLQSTLKQSTLMKWNKVVDCAVSSDDCLVSTTCAIKDRGKYSELWQQRGSLPRTLT